MADQTHAGERQPAPSRRRFLDWFLGTSAGALLLAIFYPIARYLVPPEVQESTAGTVTLSINPASVKPNSGLIFRFGSQPGILIRTPGGELRAFSAVCTHLGCTVQYQPDKERIHCACHGGVYDPRTGKNVSGPPPRPLKRYEVKPTPTGMVVSRS